jgi:DNA-binding response OmpR family regulator
MWRPNRSAPRNKIADRPRLPPAPDPTPGAPRRSKILSGDDEPFNGDSVEQELADLGYETISTANGQESLAQVAAAAPYLIWLDVMMPGMDGFTVGRLLTAQEETRLIPMVIMTPLDAKADRITGIQVGADDFLTKPVDEAELVARMETAPKLKYTVAHRMGEFSALRDQVAQFGVPVVLEQKTTILWK